MAKNNAQLTPNPLTDQAAKILTVIQVADLLQISTEAQVRVETVGLRVAPR